MNRLPASPLIVKGLEIAEKHFGIEELAIKLGSPATLVRAWRFGHAAMPEPAFLKLVDILIDLDPKWTDKVKLGRAP